MQTRFFSTLSQQQEIKKRAKRPIVTFFKPEGALTRLKMLHLTSQARLPFRGLFSDLQQKDSALYTHLLLSEWTILLKMRKRIWWMRSSTAGFISATSFGTATNDSALYAHLLLSVWTILLKMRKRIWWMCSSVGFISASSIGTLVMKLHTLVKNLFEGSWLE